MHAGVHAVIGCWQPTLATSHTYTECCPLLNDPKTSSHYIQHHCNSVIQ